MSDLIVFDEFTPADAVKEGLREIEKFKERYGRDTQEFEKIKNHPWYIRDAWLYSVVDDKLPIRRCKRCIHFKLRKKSSAPGIGAVGTCTKDKDFENMEPFTAKMELRCMFYECKDDFKDKYPVTRCEHEK